MPVDSLAPAWRPAALRGLAHAAGHEEALVALSAGQYLRVAIPAGRLEAFRARVGQRVWVDLDAWRVRLDEPTVADRA